MTARPLTVEVVSDVACPWCYLGKRRLERALSLLPNMAVTVRWRPYRLDPTIPPEGVDRKDYLTRKFGSLAAIEPAHRRLVEYCHDEGIDFHFERITRSANTIDAHRLIRWATAAGLDDAMVERLFAAYFSEGRDIGEQQVLAELAGEVGLDAVLVARRVASDEDREIVAGEIEDAYRIGVTGVPCFIFDQKYAVMGAQPAEGIADAIRQVSAERAETAPAN
ncbi:MAG: DsbA family oxidoreductase [Allosphingosinicella sp.]